MRAHKRALWRHLWRGFGALLLLLALLLAAPPAQPQVTANGNPVINCSGTITSGGTAQLLLAANGARQFYQIQNLATEAIAFSEFTTTPAVLTNGSWTLSAGSATAAGGSYTSPPGYVPTSAIYIIGTTTGDKFTCAAR